MDLNDRKNHWLEFYSGKRRTLVLVDMNYGEHIFPSPDTMEKYFQQALKKSRIQSDCFEWLDDDRVPCISPMMGTDLFAHAFGSPVVYPGDNNPFARPAVFNSMEAARLKKPELEKSTLMETIEFGLKLQKAAPDVMLQLPDIQSPLDIAALVWEKSDFFMALYDEPDAVKDFIGMISALLTEFLELWFKTFGKEFIAHYPDYYMPYGITLSEDEIGSISSGQFLEFSIPELGRLSGYFGGLIGIHCCANAKHQWALLKNIPGLVMLNLGQPNEVIREASSYFKDGPCQIYNPDQNEYTDYGAKVVLRGTADSRPKALDVLYELRELSEKYHQD